MTRRGWVLFSAMCVIWGMPYLFIKIAVEEISPSVLVVGRTAVGAAILLPWAAARGYLRPLVRRWRPLLAFTALEIAGPWLLLGDAEQELDSSTTGLLIAAVPLVAAIAARLVGDEDRLDRLRILGLVLGVVGVAALLGLDLRGTDLWAAGEVGLVILGYATAPLIVARALADVPSTGVTAAALALAALLYLPLAVAQRPEPLLPSGRVVVAVLVLAVVCTATALVVFFALIAEVGPQRALVITFINPAVAVALGIAVLGEPFTVGTAVGFPLILLGSVLATRRSVPRAQLPEGTVEQPPTSPLEEPVARP